MTSHLNNPFYQQIINKNTSPLLKNLFMKLKSQFRIVYVTMPPLQSDYYNYILSVYFSLGLDKLYDTRKLAEEAIKKSKFPGNYIILKEYSLS